ncbi:Aste57867_16298 [Aphanomyces stellatus]|uniref:Aste57867_16298 protein n=1 Tax=Aphanomyces stellatus TaxID=120398 RepID=A0A485L6C8_9STRA|nr:hypothetical protein As57867_016241 [Aphanomyces stellatus]VFT93074.1 Aste57867_16298 [Aphanomyces stellatus]
MQLVKRLAELEEELRQAKAKLPAVQPPTTDGMLAWEEVATALRDKRDESISENRQLKVQNYVRTQLVHDMRRWLALAHARPTYTPLRASWHNVTLFANPDSRALGKDWITQHLYHNADAVFARHAHPNFDASDGFFDMDIEFSDTCFHYVFYHQYTTPTSVPVLCADYMKRLCALLLVDGFTPVRVNTLKESTATTALHQLKTSMGEAVNLLCGEFHTERRSVLVAQHIHDDETWQPHLKQRNINWTCQMEPVPGSETTTRVKSIYRFSQCFSQHGYNELEDEARIVGLDLGQCPEELKEARFRLVILRWFARMRERFAVTKRLT